MAGIPFLSLLLALSVSFLISPRDWLVGSLCFFLIGLILFQFLIPTYDHLHFTSSALAYHSIFDAIIDTTPAVSPVAPFLRVFYSLTSFDMDLSAIALNSMCLSGSLICLKQSLSLNPGQSIIFSPFIFPVLSMILITANKDTSILLGISLILKAVTFPSLKKKISATVLFKTAIFATIGVLLVYFLRLYFLGFVLLATASFFLRLLLQKMRFSYHTSILLTFVTIYTCVSIVIYLKWETIRILVETYSGRTTIPLLFAVSPPDVLSVFAYPLLSWFTFVFYPLSLLFNDKLELTNQFFGFIQGSCFFVLIIYFFYKVLVSKNTSNGHVYMALLIFTHLSIQPFGSPNMGALFRLSLFENVSLIVFLANSFNVHKIFIPRLFNQFRS